MQEEMLKTSLKQRIIIIVIAALLLGSSIAVYVAIIVNGGKSSTSDMAKIDAIVEEYYSKENEIAEVLSQTYTEKFANYKSEVKAFNQESANAMSTVQTRDILVGDGAEITEENNNYYAYYIGYCADETIFQSSFDDYDNPSSLVAPLDVANMSAIEGWTTGMIGTKIGGVREITIPSQLAYQEEDAGCGANAAIRFIVLTFTPSDDVAAKYKELDEIYERYLEASYEYYYSQQSTTTSTSSYEEVEVSE